MRCPYCKNWMDEIIPGRYGLYYCSNCRIDYRSSEIDEINAELESEEEESE